MGREVGVVITDGNPAGHTGGTSERSLRSGLNSVLGFWVQYPDFLCPAGDRFMLVKHYVVAVVVIFQQDSAIYSLFFFFLLFLKLLIKLYRKNTSEYHSIW